MASINVNNISVELPIFEARDRSLKRSLLGAAGAGRIDIDRGHIIVQALRGVSFSASDGDRIALIGRNGAGKSTLLRTLAGFTEPNAGAVKTTGSIASLFSVSGFLDPNATGYENIQHAGRLLGISATKIKELTPEIEDFTELRHYLDLPVRTYSAGMSVRLAFAITTSIEPDILLLDEAITAGDSHFVSKAAKRAEELYNRTSIIVAASHDTNLLRRLCNRAFFLESGKIVASGDVDSVIEAYERHGATAIATGGPKGDEKKRVLSNPTDPSAGSPNAVLEADESTYWQVSDRKDAWIGVDLSDPHEDMSPNASSVSIRHKGGTTTLAPALRVEVSNDFFVSDIRKVGEVPSCNIDNRFTCLLQNTESGAHWRIRPIAENLAEPWTVFEMLFNTAPPSVLSDSQSKRRNPQSVVRDDADAWIAERLQNDQDPTTRWIGLDYGKQMKVSPVGLLLKQWEIGGQKNCVSRIRIDCSNDGFNEDVRTVTELVLNGSLSELHRHLLPQDHGQFASCWRVVAMEKPQSGSWGVERLAFDTGPVEAAPDDSADSCAA